MAHSRTAPAITRSTIRRASRNRAAAVRGSTSTIGGSHYLVGQFTGGNATCADPTGSEYYGRFDVAYNAKLKQWLDGGGCPEKAVYRYRNTNILGHFYTTSTSEGSALIAGGAPLQYEGVAFTACGSGSTSDGIFPVYRFKHLQQNGVYFYSMLPEEIASVRANLSHLLRDEGIAFYAHNAIAAGRYRSTGSQHYRARRQLLHDPRSGASQRRCQRTRLFPGRHGLLCHAAALTRETMCGNVAT